MELFVDNFAGAGAPMSHAMARALIESLPGREHPLPRKPGAWETRMRERMARRTA